MHNANCGWGRGNFDSAESSLNKHFEKHGYQVGANSVEAYMSKACNFANTVLQKGIKGHYVSGFTPNTYRYFYNGKYIDLAWNGGNYQIISFGGING